MTRVKAEGITLEQILNSSTLDKPIKSLVTLEDIIGAENGSVSKERQITVKSIERKIKPPTVDDFVSLDEKWFFCSRTQRTRSLYNRIHRNSAVVYSGPKKRNLKIYYTLPDTSIAEKTDALKETFLAYILDGYDINGYYCSLKIAAMRTREEVEKVFDVLHFWGFTPMRYSNWDETPRIEVIKEVRFQLKHTEVETTKAQKKAAICQCQLAEYKAGRPKMKKKKRR